MATAKHPDGLSELERRFVEAYMGKAGGNVTKAAKSAGYSKKTAASIGSRLLKRVKIQQAIASRAESAPDVADRQERQKFLTDMLRNKKAHPLARLKASDQLNKMQGEYIKRVQFENPPPFRLILDE